MKVQVLIAVHKDLPVRRESRGEEVGVLSVDDESAGSSKVLNVTRARDDFSFGENTQTLQLGHKHEKRVRAKWCPVYTLRRLQWHRHFLFAKPLVGQKKLKHFHIEEDHQDWEPVHADEEEDESDHVYHFHCRS